jgi:NAD(P)-dependent dehydrogenase (short-subunit alcohol dehydrogenase family)
MAKGLALVTGASSGIGLSPLVDRLLPAERTAAGDGQIEGCDVQTASSVLPGILGRSAQLRWNR